MSVGIPMDKMSLLEQPGTFPPRAWPCGASSLLDPSKARSLMPLSRQGPENLSLALPPTWRPSLVQSWPIPSPTMPRRTNQLERLHERHAALAIDDRITVAEIAIEKCDDLRAAAIPSDPVSLAPFETFVAKGPHTMS
ncbi:MAG: hypothetical protein ACR2OU_19165 [Thermomicrobiales bacterium]